MSLLTDLMDMNFNSEPTLTKIESQKSEDKPDMLADVFASFGVDIKQESHGKEPDEEGKNAEMNIPLPDFQTVDIKVKRILDSIPDYSYIFD